MSRLKDSLSKRQKESLKRILRVCLSVLPYPSLELLALAHGTDKRVHGYLEHYRRYFGSIRRKRLNILEIGVGRGGSLGMWQMYFSRSMIYAIDIEDKSQYEDKRIKIVRGSQNDPIFLQRVVTEIGPIDIVIDDGSHVCEHVITSFHTLFPHLTDNGIYVIEDTHTSYWPQYGGDWKNLNNPRTTMAMLKGQVDGLNYEYIPKRLQAQFDSSIASIHFYQKIVFVFKGRNEHVLSASTQRKVEQAGAELPDAGGGGQT